MKEWLRLFRVVNLPTVPGDIWIGAVAVWRGVGILFDWGAPLFNATISGALLYLFGLVDNDIVGATTDRDRPIAQGRISLSAAKRARTVCLVLAVLVGIVPDPFAHCSLSLLWWVCAAALTVTILFYNRIKSCLLMGFCRGLNVVCGGAVALDVLRTYPDVSDLSSSVIWLACVMLVWVAYIFAVTKFSEGEELDPARKRLVGFLVGAIVLLQLAGLLLFRSGLAAVVLVLFCALLLLRGILPKVSPS